MEVLALEIKKSFFQGHEGKIEIYSLKNDNKMEVEILSIGGVIRKIITCDRHGNYNNIVLGLENLSDYFQNPSYFGAIPGRTSGRIGGAKAAINGRTYYFCKNNGENNLHGGKEGLFHKFWKGEIVQSENSVGVLLSYNEEDGVEGFPGNLHLEVLYELDNENNLSITYKGSADKTTLLNLTNHSYFNLSGVYKEDILTHKLKINSDEFCEIDKDSIVTGKLISVKGTPFDFRNEKSIGKNIDDKNNLQIKYGNGYDHPYILLKNNEPAVVLEHDKAGRGLKIYTDTKALVFYTMNYTNNEELCNGEKAKERIACCFETQAPPIGYNDEFLDNSLLNKGEVYESKTIYKFYTF